MERGYTGPIGGAIRPNPDVPEALARLAYLSPRRPGEPEWIKYEVAERPNLYLRFAELAAVTGEALTDAIAAFASEHGVLTGIEAEVGDPVPQEQPVLFEYAGRRTYLPAARPLSFADSLGTWLSEIRRLELPVRMWEDAERSLATGQFVTDAPVRMAYWVDDLSVSVNPRTRFSSLPPGVLRLGWHPALDGHDARQRAAAATALVRRAVRERVADELNRQTTFTDVADVVAARPRNLLGALWVQFANAITRADEWVRCSRSSCGRRWARERDGESRRTRSDRRYCSDTCRKAANRARI